MDLSSAHWIYLGGMVVIIAVMILRKNVVIPALVATFGTAWAFSGSIITGFQAIFNASLTAAAELFNIFLIIAFVTALLGALRELGSDQRMISPFRTVMRNGHLAYWVIALAAYLISLFFWPTPAVPLIGAILLPAAIRAGLPPMGAALAIAIAGQGMALSSDYIIQVAPGMSATAASTQTGAVADYALVLSLVTGCTALVIGYLMTRSQILAPDPAHLVRWENSARSETQAVRTIKDIARTPDGDTVQSESIPKQRAAEEPASLEHAPAATAGAGDAAATGGPAGGGTPGRAGGTGGEAADDPPDGAVRSDDRPAAQPPVLRSKAFAVLVPLVFLALIVYMLLGKFTALVPELADGGGAAALVGGAAAVLLMLATIAGDGRSSLESCATHVVDGMVFAFKAMGIVIPIAGFFFIGNADFAGRILQLPPDSTAPSFLFDLVQRIESHIPGNPVVIAFGMVLLGAMTGLDGSGFSGLPLTGSLAHSFGENLSLSPEVLAALGQMGSIWTGGGVLIAWSSLIAIAGFARVPVLDLVRRAFVPVVCGLVTATLVGAWLMV